MHYVYSLKCKDGFYIGCTEDLKERIKRHQNGSVPATKNRLPVELDFLSPSGKNIKRLNLKNISRLVQGERL